MAFCGGIELRLTLLHHRFAGPHFALPLIEQRAGGGHGALCLFDLCGGFQTLLVQYPGIHLRQHFALANKLSLFDQNIVDTPGGFGGDIHLGGFNSAVAAGEPVRQSWRTQRPPRHGGNDHRDTHEIPGPMPFDFVHTLPALFPVAEWRAFRDENGEGCCEECYSCGHHQQSWP